MLSTFPSVPEPSVAATLSADQLQDWGWRLAILVGASIVPFGLWLRRALPAAVLKGLRQLSHRRPPPITPVERAQVLEIYRGLLY